MSPLHAALAAVAAWLSMHFTAIFGIKSSLLLSSDELTWKSVTVRFWRVLSEMCMRSVTTIGGEMKEP